MPQFARVTVASLLLCWLGADGENEGTVRQMAESKSNSAVARVIAEYEKKELEKKGESWRELRNFMHAAGGGLGSLFEKMVTKAGVNSVTELQVLLTESPHRLEEIGFTQEQQDRLQWGAREL
jgi:hypothetical protein